jgi:hypothetical protein
MPDPERLAFQPFDLAHRWDDDRDALLGDRHSARRPSRWWTLLAGVSIVLAAAALVISTRFQAAGTPAAAELPAWRRLAFGSCTSYDLRPQPIWDAVVGAQPDGWIWLGDLAYLDTALVDCAQVPSHRQCNCSLGVTSPPYFTSCLPLDLAYAQFRFQAQVSLLAWPAPGRLAQLHPHSVWALQINMPGYQRLLSYLCPGHQPGGPPPDGGDPSTCPKPLLGIYDDHDFGANNADGRSVVIRPMLGQRGSTRPWAQVLLCARRAALPALATQAAWRAAAAARRPRRSTRTRTRQHRSSRRRQRGQLARPACRNPEKVALKQLYLDAIGAPRGSPRRSAVAGAQAAYTLNAGSAGREVQVLLLDERCGASPAPGSWGRARRRRMPPPPPPPTAPRRAAAAHCALRRRQPRRQRPPLRRGRGATAPPPPPPPPLLIAPQVGPGRAAVQRGGAAVRARAAGPL